MGAAASTTVHKFDSSIFEEAIAEAARKSRNSKGSGSSAKSQSRHASVRRNNITRTVESETYLINAQLHSLVVSKDMALAKSFRAVLDKRDKLVKILTEKKSGLDVEFRCDDETMPTDGDAGKLVLLPHLTPLQQAVVQRNYEAVDVLLEYGQSDPSALLPCDVLLRRNNNDDEDSGSEKVAFNGLPEGTSTIMLALRNLLDMEINAKASDGRLPYNWGPACDICRRLLACKDVDVHAGWSRWGRDESAFTVARELLMAPAFLMACGDEAAAVREIAALVLRHPSNGGDAANILRRKSVDY